MNDVDIRELSERIERKSAFVDMLNIEMGKENEKYTI